jgi:2-polyprenyl-3-methyl-5-hydroxy-6-metoxy-1,4-benzoquinol methylase
MPSLLHRSYQTELLDRDDIPFDDIRRNMEELNTINAVLGGHGITLKGLKALMPQNITAPIHIVEIGCGGGDNLRVIQGYARRHQIPVQLTGIDINPSCIAFAKSQQSQKDINFIASDYADVLFDEQPHIIFSSLFCHHFKEGELVSMLQWMKENVSLGFFINDLHRHPLAFYSIKWLTAAFSKSYLVKNDAPVSVQRGFSKKEWQQLFSDAGICDYTVQWKWAFRWLVICRNQ